MKSLRWLAPALAGAALICFPAIARAANTINLEIDWLYGPGHTHKPTQCELDSVKNAFAAHGWTLNIVLGDAIPETGTNRVIDFHSPALFDSAAGTWHDIESTYRNHAEGSGWHYCVFGHDYSFDGGPTGSSGLAEINGDEFVVTVGSFTPDSMGSAWDRAGTLMHELGHNLSLRHSGDQDESVVRQYKPDYASLMAYRYQLVGVKNGLICQGLATALGAAAYKNMDYSSGTLGPLDEYSLIECNGVGLGMAVDWDCNNAIAPCNTTVAKDISSAGGGAYGLNWCLIPIPILSTLTDYNDWNNITDSALNLAPADATAKPVEVVSCITVSELNALSVSAINCAQPNIPCDAVVATLASLVSSDAEPDRVRLVWQLEGASRATLYRRDDHVGWSAIATLDADGEGMLRYEDRQVVPGERYGYRLGVRDGADQQMLGEVWLVVPLRPYLALADVVPNPTSHGLNVSFWLASGERAAIEVVDVAGRRITSHEVGSLGPGAHSIDLAAGLQLPAGIYTIRLVQGGKALTTRVAVVR
ncbi:MAG: T9SS type A sorting domain-containing protein [Candidatus Eisenbacteria bacterium]|nr:T9SS type A sorting domain-containing protein [Candidatus Eisenbacteria bacterium]